MIAKHPVSHGLGIVVLLLLLLFIYLNNFAGADNLFHGFRLQLVGLFLVLFLVHYCMLATDALKERRYIWAVALFVAPIPTYWIYYGFTLFMAPVVVQSAPEGTRSYSEVP